jgi:hypothetical protein
VLGHDVLLLELLADKQVCPYHPGQETIAPGGGTPKLV